MSADQASRRYDSITVSGPGVSIFGDVGTLVQPQPEPSSTQAVKYGLCLGAAPQIDPTYFVGRAIEIEEISRILQPEVLYARHRRLVLGGMGGIGKTQLALTYAQRYQESYDSVFWLNATSQLTLQADLRLVAVQLLSAREIEGLSDEQVLTRVHEWLSNPQNTRWLLILDNHDEPDQFNIDKYISNAGHGSVIITTRLPDLLNGEQIRIQPLNDVQEHLAILQTRSQRTNISNDPGACRLASRLAGLPLALATAGAHLRKTTMTCEQYLCAYEERFNINPRRPIQLQEYQDRTLYTTWDLSYHRLERDDPLAAQLLRILAYFDNQQIWFELFSAGLTSEAPKWLQEVAANHIDFENVMATLVEYSLVEAHPEPGFYSIHSCVHDWTLAQLNATISDQSYWYAVRCVVKNTAGDDWTKLRQFHYARLARHALRCILPRFGNIFQTERLSLSDVNGLNRVAELLEQQAQLLEAEQMYLRVLVGYEKTLGADHFSTLATVNNLGILYRSQSKLNEAQQMYLRALAGYEKTLGADHFLTLETVDNLGCLYRDQGKLNEAEQMHLRALAGFEELLGPDCASTLKTVSNLGNLYYDQGKLDEAEQMYLRALAGKEKVRGLDHHLTLNTFNNLGLLYIRQGKLNKAETMFSRALDGLGKDLGPKHSSTLYSQHGLAKLYHKQGKLSLAESIYQRVLTDFETTLGDHHLWTIDLISDFGLLYEAQDRREEAKCMYQRALIGCQTQLGLEHPMAREVADNLTRLDRQQVQAEEEVVRDKIQTALVI